MLGYSMWYEGTVTEAYKTRITYRRTGKSYENRARSKIASSGLHSIGNTYLVEVTGIL